jgi:hypothetical protein
VPGQAFWRLVMMVRIRNRLRPFLFPTCNKCCLLIFEVIDVDHERDENAEGQAVHILSKPEKSLTQEGFHWSEIISLRIVRLRPDPHSELFGPLKSWMLMCSQALNHGSETNTSIGSEC